MSQLLIYPMEVVKVRLAVTPHGTYQGIWDVLRRVMRKEGIKGLYRGLTPSLIGIFPYAGCDIMLFEVRPHSAHMTVALAPEWPEHLRMKHPEKERA